MTNPRERLKRCRRYGAGAIVKIVGVSIATVAFIASTAPDAIAHGADLGPEPSAEELKNPFRESTLSFEQSITTQTTGLGPAPQSYVPLYELWFSLRPDYWFNEHWAVRARLDYSK